MDSFLTWPTSSQFAQPLPILEGIRNPLDTAEREPGWWATQWINLVQRSNIGYRLERAKYYAFLGQVFSIEILEGRIQGLVQGAVPEPYRISISMPVISASRWSGVLESVLDFRTCVRLFSGDLPLEFAPLLKKFGDIDLIPEDFQSFHSKCTCPDWSNPCKHIAAVHLLVAYELDRDPLVLLKFRGLNKDTLLDCLQRWVDGNPKKNESQANVTEGGPPKADPEGGSPARRTTERFDALSQYQGGGEDFVFASDESEPQQANWSAQSERFGATAMTNNNEGATRTALQEGAGEGEEEEAESLESEFSCYGSVESPDTSKALKEHLETLFGDKSTSAYKSVDSQQLSHDVVTPSSYWEGGGTFVSASVYFDSVRKQGFSTMKECLGGFPFWRSQYDFERTLSEAYNRAALRAKELAEQ